MLTVGVDLAAEPKKTAMALIDWSPGHAKVVGLQVGVRDEPIVDAAADCVKVGIDCPLGWPVPFVQFISSHHDGHVMVPAGVEGLVWRRQLAFRTTDAAVRELTGQRLIPLSVAADRIGHTAMRCAALMAAMALRGLQVDRAGTGLVVEVYPAASLWRWQLPHRGCKGRANAATRHRLVEALQRDAPWLDLAEHEHSCRDDDDALDAVLAAITAQYAHLNLVTQPSPNQRPR